MKYSLLLLLLSVCGSAVSAELLLEKGERHIFFARPDNFSQAFYSAIAIRSDGDLFVEGIQGGWHGKEYARFTGMGIGGKSKNKWFVEYVISVVYLTESTLTDQGGDYQALLTAGIGYKVNNFSLVLRFRHFSNGNTQDDNYGRDFWAIGPNVKF